MADTFDPNLYTRGIVITLSNGITLARALVSLAPRNLPPLGKKSARKLAAAADAAQGAQQNRQRELNIPTESVDGLIDLEADHSWGSLRARLQSLADLPGNRSNRPARAGKLVIRLFGDDGLKFLALDYQGQLTVMDSMLKRIAADKLEAEIDELAGPEYLLQLRDVQHRYARMVSNRLAQEMAARDDLRQHVRALLAAITDYANKVTATVDEDEPETLQAARAALQPILNHREQAARRSASGGGGKEPPPAEDGVTAGEGGK